MLLYLLLTLVLFFGQAKGQRGFLETSDTILAAVHGKEVRDPNFLENVVTHAIEEAQGHRIFPERNNVLISSSEPFIVHGKMMAASGEAEKVAIESEILLKATEILVKRFGHGILMDLEHIDVSRYVKFPELDKRCDFNSKYRTFDGSCNNLHNPMYGTAFNTLRRLLPPKYEDEISAPRSFSITGVPLPSPRLISNRIHQYKPARSQQFSLLLMQFGQLVDHEITHAPVSQTKLGGNLNCSSCDSITRVSSSCLPIPVPKDDPQFSGCLPFVRTLSGQRKLGPKEQLNQITSFLDGSVFYGSTKKISNTLRLFKGGKLRSTAGGSHLGLLLPEAEDQGECKSFPQFPCFASGDSRNSQQPMLQSLHVIFHRHHNSIADQLANIRQDWNDLTIFQETRRIVSAQFNHIIYSEFLPKIIGKNEMSNIYSFHQGLYSQAAFRFGHSLITRLYPIMNEDFKNVSSAIDLTDNFNNMKQIYNANTGSIDSILAGMAASSSMSFDAHISTAVRNHLFAQRSNPGSGMDLAAINIQRGRDHGVGSYNDYREFCGRPRAITFASLLSEMDFKSIEALEKTYAHVDDIDLFTGLLAERPEYDTLVGPTTICLLSEQFARLKHCDRYFYDLQGPGEFTREQLAEIQKTTFASIICANSRLSYLQPLVFELPDEFLNAQASCDSFPQLDLSNWT